jgi:hypothetical protein
MSIKEELSDEDVDINDINEEARSILNIKDKVEEIFPNEFNS